MGAVGSKPQNYWDNLVKKDRSFQYNGNGIADFNVSAASLAEAELKKANTTKLEDVGGWVINRDLNATIGSDELKTAINSICDVTPQSGASYDAGFLALIQIDQLIKNPGSEIRFVNATDTMRTAWDKAVGVWGERSVQLIAADLKLSLQDKLYYLSELKRAANHLPKGKGQALVSAIDGAREAVTRLL